MPVGTGTYLLGSVALLTFGSGSGASNISDTSSLLYIKCHLEPWFMFEFLSFLLVGAGTRCAGAGHHYHRVGGGPRHHGRPPLPPGQDGRLR